MANNPNTHVIPSRGVTIIAALISDLMEFTKKQIDEIFSITCIIPFEKLQF